MARPLAYRQTRENPDARSPTAPPPLPSPPHRPDRGGGSCRPPRSGRRDHSVRSWRRPAHEIRLCGLPAPVRGLRARRQLHAQLLLPPRPQLHPVVSRLGTRRPEHRGGDERVDLERRPGDRRGDRTGALGGLPLLPQLVPGRPLAGIHRRRWRRPHPAGSAGHKHRGDPPPHRRRRDPCRSALLPRRHAAGLRLHPPQRLLQHLHPRDRRRAVGRRRGRHHLRQHLRPQPPLLRGVGHAHLPLLAALRRRTAHRLQPRRAPGKRQRLPDPGPGERHRQPRGGAGGADPLPDPARRLPRRPPLRLLVHGRGRRPVQQPVRPAHGRRRALQAHLLRVRRLPPALVAGRRVDRLHQQQGRTAPARTARDLRRGSTHRHHRRASLEGADGHPHDDHPGRGRRADGHPHPPHRLRRQALHPRGRVLAHQPGGRPHLPPRRILPGRTAPRQRAHDDRARLRACAPGIRRQHRRGRRRPHERPAGGDLRPERRRLVLRVDPRAHELRRKSS